MAFVSKIRREARNAALARYCATAHASTPTQAPATVVRLAIARAQMRAISAQAARRARAAHAKQAHPAAKPAQHPARPARRAMKANASQLPLRPHAALSRASAPWSTPATTSCIVENAGHRKCGIFKAGVPIAKTESAEIARLTVTVSLMAWPKASASITNAMPHNAKRVTAWQGVIILITTMRRFASRKLSVISRHLKACAGNGAPYPALWPDTGCAHRYPQADTRCVLFWGGMQRMRGNTFPHT